MKTIREISDGLNAVVKAIGVGKLSTMYESPRIQELAAALSEHVSDELRVVTGVALHTIERGDRVRIMDNIAHMIPEGFDEVADQVAYEKASIVQQISDFADGPARHFGLDPVRAEGTAIGPDDPLHYRGPAEGSPQSPKPVGEGEQSWGELPPGVLLRDLPNLGQSEPANDAPGGADEVEIDRTAEFGATGGE